MSTLRSSMRFLTAVCLAWRPRTLKDATVSSVRRAPPPVGFSLIIGGDGFCVADVTILVVFVCTTQVHEFRAVVWGLGPIQLGGLDADVAAVDRLSVKDGSGQAVKLLAVCQGNLHLEAPLDREVFGPLNAVEGLQHVCLELLFLILLSLGLLELLLDGIVAGQETQLLSLVGGEVEDFGEDLLLLCSVTDQDLDDVILRERDIGDLAAGDADALERLSDESVGESLDPFDVDPLHSVHLLAEGLVGDAAVVDVARDPGRSLGGAGDDLQLSVGDSSGGEDTATLGHLLVSREALDVLCGLGDVGLESLAVAHHGRFGRRVLLLGSPLGGFLCLFGFDLLDDVFNRFEGVLDDLDSAGRQLGFVGALGELGLEGLEGFKGRQIFVVAFAAAVAHAAGKVNLGSVWCQVRLDPCIGSGALSVEPLDDGLICAVEELFRPGGGASGHSGPGVEAGHLEVSVLLFASSAADAVAFLVDC
ncbi:uncharacterized protein BJ171DRAFT_30543 [Polychytrium aggregatum]|uniref:uncharacterized protein n=1 Tax=Polychytrium aggregatum TaxID=110093 RepID=UPI0022FE7072|nr:uncharacterized protein BJ171DRAFT_30543 [Polychytrium aggregatum]KAI9206443.1 hypothetical protein BJ171DRAFT_30543 [Polychytrium aggregatum]